MQPIRRALISVSDKRDLIGFARALRQFGVEIISTGGTATNLEQSGIDVVRVEQLSDLSGFLVAQILSRGPRLHR